MKNNLISGIASWKSAALLAIVAVVAAVAFSGVLTNTQSADAAGPGDTTTVSVTGITAFTSPAAPGIATFTIAGGTASGSFAANGGQTLICSDEGACDSAKTGADNPAGGTYSAGDVTVALNIDEDSANGFILISVTDAAAPAEAATIIRVDVTTADRVTSLTASAPPGSAIDADADNTQTENQVIITARAQNSVEGGVNGKPVIIFTTLGLLDGCGTNSNVQACTENTADTDRNNDGDTTDDNESGVVQVTLKATGRSGVATVSFTQGTHTASVDVVMYGDAATFSAEAMQSSITNISGETYIVVTVLDDGGNPVVGHPVSTRSQGVAGGDIDTDGVVGPGAKAIEVDVSDDKDFINVADPTKNLPACNNAPAGDNPATADVTETDYDPFTAGTNAAGKCVFHVLAPYSDDNNPANDATRGTNTVHIAGLAAPNLTQDVAVEIQVGGAPAEISTDAPARVDALSSTTVTITVVDDEGVRVGAVSKSVTQVEGDGALIAGGGVGTTSDGTTTFTYLAPSRSGTAVFRVTAGSGAGTIAHNVVIDIGPEPVEEPEGPAPTWNNPLASGTHNLVWVGADGADPADAGDNIVAIWQWTGSGWDGYFAEAGDVGLANTLTELENGEAYWVVVQ